MRCLYRFERFEYERDQKLDRVSLLVSFLGLERGSILAQDTEYYCHCYLPRLNKGETIPYTTLVLPRVYTRGTETSLKAKRPGNFDGSCQPTCEIKFRCSTFPIQSLSLVTPCTINRSIIFPYKHCSRSLSWSLEKRRSRWENFESEGRRGGSLVEENTLRERKSGSKIKVGRRNALPIK